MTHLARGEIYIFSVIENSNGGPDSEGGARLGERAANCPEQLRAKPDQQDDKQHHDTQDYDGVERCERGEPNREYVLYRTQKKIRDWLGTRVGGQTDTGFGRMGAEGEATSRQQCCDSNGRAEVREGGGRQHGAGGNTDEGVNGIPNGIHDWYFVGEELDQVHEAGNRDYPPLAQEIEIAWQPDQVKPRQQPKCCHRGVEINAREPGRAHPQANCGERIQLIGRSGATATREAHAGADKSTVSATAAFFLTEAMPLRMASREEYI